MLRLFSAFANKYNAALHCAKDEAGQMKQRRFACHLCPKSLSTFQSLQRHLVNLHSSKNKLRDTELLECDICGSKFKSKLGLSSHKQRHTSSEKPFECRYCDKKFQLESSLVKHAEKCHSSAVSQSGF